MAPSKRELVEQRDEALRENITLTLQRDDALNRLASALAVATKAEFTLTQLFGPLNDLGPDQNCEVLRFDSVDGIVRLRLHLKGELQMIDPEGAVPDKVLNFAPNGELLTGAAEAVKTFRKDVKASRVPDDIKPVYGLLSLTASAPPKVVTPEETAALALDGTKH